MHRVIYFNDNCMYNIFILALKIHVSPFTKEVLDTFNTFILECRGDTEMKVRLEVISLDCYIWILNEPVLKMISVNYG